MGKTKFVIIGGGWRADFYLRIAKALPDEFEVGGMLVRNEEKGQVYEETWGVKTYRDLDALLGRSEFSFAVVSVPWEACPVYIRELASRGIPVLAETPPAPDLAGLTALYEAVGGESRIQVAEQYLFQPLHAACLALARSGRLGAISQAQVSAAHGYHGVSLMRALLQVEFETAEISGQRFVAPIVEGPGRDGPPTEEKLRDSTQDIAMLRFGNRLGIFDFTGDQYFSWIRRNRLLVRGSHGEIVNEEASWLADYRTPIHAGLRRVDTGHNGNLEGYAHSGILLGSEWLYRNPFAPGRLSDDEIAIATSLRSMGAYAQGGPSFYSLAEASQDHYLGMLIQQAIETGVTVTSERQIWS